MSPDGRRATVVRGDADAAVLRHRAAAASCALPVSADRSVEVEWRSTTSTSCGGL